MPRLHIIYLPDDPGARFAFILDQTNPMTETAITAWQSFAEKCGAQDIMLTADTIDTDPETSDGWEPDDDEPVGYFATDHNHDGCEGHTLSQLVANIVRHAHDTVWVDWKPANLDPESPRVKTHREEVCPALNDGMTGCPMHAPILEGGWVTWPYYATAQGVVSRICEHGVTHPTPEEYLGGFDTPHLCDGCPCAPVADFAIVISDLAQTQLPRGTLLLGVKDNPEPSTAPPAEEQATNIRCAARFQLAAGSVGCNLLHGHYGQHDGGGKTWPNDTDPADNFRDQLAGLRGTASDETLPDVLRGAPVSGGVARFQKIGADGEPVGKPMVTELDGPVTVVGCSAGGADSRCTLEHGHEGLHDFRVI